MNSNANNKPPGSLVSGKGVEDSRHTRAWFTLSIAEVIESLGGDAENGLTQDEAARRLSQYGSNVLAHVSKRSAFSIFLAQFRSLIVGLLVAAMTIAFIMGENLEAISILIVIVLNACIGFFTEWKAEESLSALQKQSVQVAHVIRDGVAREIPAAELVPGDLIVLAAGARVPADGRIVESVRLQIEEAALTGESLPVNKHSELLEDHEAALGDRLNMAFQGTTITDGRGRLLVTATGAQTEMGKIGILIDEAMTSATPLEKKLVQLGHLLTVIVLVFCAVIILAGWFRGTADFWHMLEMGLSLAIASVPEGLPAVTTMTLAIGMQRMARMNALIRRLPAVETLGSVTVICTDKTGTLTRNEMTVCVYSLNHRRIDVSGAGYEAVGNFQEGHKSVTPCSDEHLALALRVGLLCNDAKVERTHASETILGDPTEAALIVAAEKAGMEHAVYFEDYPRLSEVPFNSVSKRMVTVHGAQEGKVLAFMKGSPRTLLDLSCSQVCDNGVSLLTVDERNRWEAANQELASAGLRVLALAYRELPENYSDDDLAKDYIFVGLVGMSDPLRDEAKAAIASCREAGIRTVMITGDQQPTAAAIAHELEIDTDFQGNPLRTVHGRDLVDLDAAGWQQIVSDAGVFARASPAHKLQIVDALQLQGQVVAMTGDGVNDAPALKKADIGIAMGIKGTEVAKENADMVITDDNFASIVGAVKQGRIIYGNIIRFLHYLLSCNFSEVLIVFIALILGWPLPLLALQVLWLNFLTDIFPAFALALEPPNPDVMKRSPRDPQEPLLSRGFIFLVIWQGLLLTGVTLIAFAIGMNWHGSEGMGLRRATTMAFITLALAQIFHAFNARSQKRSVFSSQLFTNAWMWGAVMFCITLQMAAVYVPLLQKVLHTIPPTASDWGIILACSLTPVGVIEVIKAINARQNCK